ncbi:MAG: hypothetical protein IT371_29465 [Deltaproteobacteria bacterium]|nr:hypothetical protein [Deltaproteobacteria bacterium]
MPRSRAHLGLLLLASLGLLGAPREASAAGATEGLAEQMQHLNSPLFNLRALSPHEQQRLVGEHRQALYRLARRHGWRPTEGPRAGHPPVTSDEVLKDALFTAADYAWRASHGRIAVLRMVRTVAELISAALWEVQLTAEAIAGHPRQGLEADPDWQADRQVERLLGPSPRPETLSRL